MTHSTTCTVTHATCNIGVTLPEEGTEHELHLHFQKGISTDEIRKSCGMIYEVTSCDMCAPAEQNNLKIYVMLPEKCRDNLNTAKVF